MTEEHLQLLITLDDPVNPPEEDTFNHLVANNLGYWFAQRFPEWRRLDQRQKPLAIVTVTIVNAGGPQQ
ncbi:MAG TPA: hypothetical protein VFY60_13940 [Pyrinomonadaceae bacterium]|nr:hypothetical protein [Pyrinomonadaceae bacterium]